MDVRTARKKKGLTQEELAEQINFTQAAISAFERGDTVNPSWLLIGRLSRALDVDPFDLFPVEDAR